MTIHRILVAVDGSANSLAAAHWTADLAAALDAEVVAVHAVGLLDRTAAHGLEPCRSHRDEIAADLDGAWTQPLRDAGVPLRCELRDGPPAMVVLAVAEDAEVDLIVIGSRGVGAHPERLLGSTSTQVAQHSTRPVTVIPPAHDV